MRKITETDVRWLAKGYWGNHFNWRLHPKTRAAFALCGAALLVLFVLLVASAATVAPTSATPDGTAVAQTSPIPSAAIMATLLVFVAALLWGFFVYSRERDDYIDRAVRLWEKDEVLPDRDTVIEFINRGG